MLRTALIKPLEMGCLQPLGAVLQQAGLVSAAQVEAALQEQAQSRNLRLGEVLALHGWLKLATATFFAEQWPRLRHQNPPQQLEQCLEAAGLLDAAQIAAILKEQQQTGVSFGALAVAKGWLKQATLDFFLAYVAPSPCPQVQKQWGDQQDPAVKMSVQEPTQPDQPILLSTPHMGEQELAFVQDCVSVQLDCPRRSSSGCL